MSSRDCQHIQIVRDPMEDRHEQNKTSRIDPHFGNGCVGRHSCDSDQLRRAPMIPQAC
jgi:hypothetical protein